MMSAYRFGTSSMGLRTDLPQRVLEFRIKDKGINTYLRVDPAIESRFEMAVRP